MESVNKIKPSQQPYIPKIMGPPTDSPTDLLRHLNNKLTVSSPIHQLSALLRESNVVKRHPSKLKIVSKDPLWRRTENEK